MVFHIDFVDCRRVISALTNFEKFHFKTCLKAILLEYFQLFIAVLACILRCL